MEITTAPPMTTVPIGTAVRTGTPISIPLRRDEHHSPVVITGDLATGKTTIATRIVDHVTQHGWHAAHVCGVASPTPDLNEFTEQDGFKVLVLDDAERVLQRERDEWARAVRLAPSYGVTLIAVTRSVLPRAFGDHPSLRNLLLNGSIIRLRTNDPSDQAHESCVDLSQLDRCGHGYVQTPEMDVAIEFRSHPA